jgi:hypothetical protein
MFISATVPEEGRLGPQMAQETVPGHNVSPLLPSPGGRLYPELPHGHDFECFVSSAIPFSVQHD